MGNVENVGNMYVEKCVREYIEDNKEGILEVLEKVYKKADFEEICGEVRDGVCDRIADEFREDRYWDVYWDVWDEVYECVVEEIGKILNNNLKGE